MVLLSDERHRTGPLLEGGAAAARGRERARRLRVWRGGGWGARRRCPRTAAAPQPESARAHGGRARAPDIAAAAAARHRRGAARAEQSELRRGRSNTAPPPPAGARSAATRGACGSCCAGRAPLGGPATAGHPDTRHAPRPDLRRGVRSSGKGSGKARLQIKRLNPGIRTVPRCCRGPPAFAPPIGTSSRHPARSGAVLGIRETLRRPPRGLPTRGPAHTRPVLGERAPPGAPGARWTAPQSRSKSWTRATWRRRASRRARSCTSRRCCRSSSGAARRARRPLLLPPRDPAAAAPATGPPARGLQPRQRRSGGAPRVASRCATP
jgi:hypothetical protein